MLSDLLKQHLTGKLIPFWKMLKDDEYGGFYGWMDSDLKVDRYAVKGCILNSRILWFFSNAFLCLCREEQSLGTSLEPGTQADGERDVKPWELRACADHAYRFLRECCLDSERGGVYWSVTYEGKPQDTTKHTYNQAFAVYALSSYYRAFHVEEAFQTAVGLVRVLEEKCFEEHGYQEAQDLDFHSIENDKLSENGVMADRTMNTLLHVLEAYTEFLLACREAADSGIASGNQIASWTEGKLKWILEFTLHKVYHPELHRLEVFFDRDMESLIDLHSYGHDIEASWLLDRCLEALGEKAWKKSSWMAGDLVGDCEREKASNHRSLGEEVESMAKALAEEVYHTAYQAHSLANECERGVVNQSRVWWVQAEAVVGFYNAWQETGEEKYLAASRDIWHFIEEHMVDPREGGEWFWSVDEMGKPDLEKPIVEPWKCPYHNGRMCMEIIRREGMEPCPKYFEEKKKQEALLNRKNEVDDSFYNGIFQRYRYPVLTREHTPLIWRYDLNPKTNPYFEERLGINAVMNSGAIYLDGKFYLVARVEGNDRKSFFAVAESESGVEGFRFWDYPVVLPDTCPEETNVYDMRLTQHEDGYIYGVFCSESKDRSSSDLSAAVAAAGIVRTKDLKTWERLPNLKTLRSPQQRNVVLHPEFIDGKYAFYTRPMDDFIDTGSGGGIGYGLCEDITHAVIDEERMTSCRRYHTITESKNGAGAVPIKTPEGWIHIAHGVRNTAAGLRYVIYAFATALEDPGRVIAQPSGLLIAPRGEERIGDVSNVVFTNGAVALPDGRIYIYYASSDTRLHVATTTMERLTDYVFHTPEDPLRSSDCVKQRCGLIERNLEFLERKGL